jgi:hypothetical protein
MVCPSLHRDVDKPFAVIATGLKTKKGNAWRSPFFVWPEFEETKKAEE